MTIRMLIKSKRFSARFTLIEMLVVIAIIGILAGFLMGAVSKAMAQGRTSACSSNLRQTGLALQLYYNNWNELGPYCTGTCYWDGDPVGWTQQLINLTQDKQLYRCPEQATTEYAYFLGVRAAFVQAGGRASVRRSSIQKPGLYVAGGDVPKAQLQPTGPFELADNDKDDYSTKVFGTDVHHGRQNILFADNHVRAMADYEPGLMTYRYSTISDWQ